MNKREEIFSTHFRKGSKLPATDGSKIRLYNMAFCPYGHRVLLTADAKKISMEIINIDLANAPEWMYTKGFSGVPVLEFEGKMIKESLDICEWLDEFRSSERSVMPETIAKRREERKWAENFQNVVQVIFPLFFKVFENSDATPLLIQLTKELGVFDEELKIRGTPFFSGKENPGFLDYAIWPFIERLVIMKTLYPGAIDFASAKEKVPHLEAWRLRMEADPSVKNSFLDTTTHHMYIENRRNLSRGSATSINYDIVV